MAEITGLHIKVTTQPESKDRDVWLCFKAENGKSAMISVAALADRQAGIVAAALRGWASDRVGEHDEAAIAAEDAKAEREANGQFGVGA